MKYKRVFLIEPAYPGSVYVFPVWPLGLGYIAESLRFKGIEYKVIDLRFQHDKGSLYKEISNFKPELIGISAMSSKYKYLYRLIKSIKRIFPDIPIVIGGAHVSTLREDVLLKCPEIDYGIVGEGEEAIAELCEGKDTASIKGLIYRKYSDVIYNGDRGRILNLDSVPFPTYEGFEIARYEKRSMNIVSSRGCPYECIYCCVKLVSGQRWIARSSGNVIKEITYWRKKGYSIFNFSDDAFNINRQRVIEICEEVNRVGLKIELNASNGIRADKADRELLIKMKDAGFAHIAFGVEAGTNKVLSSIKKGETIEIIEKAINNACELGYQVTLFFLIGSPGETEEDIRESFKLATRYPVADVRFYNLIPFPNTELYEWIKKNDYFLLRPENYLNENMGWSDKPVFFTPELGIKKRRKIYITGLRLGNELRKARLFLYYKKAFKKIGVFCNLFAYIASRSIFQFLLKKVVFLQKLRNIFKKIIFD